MERKIIIRTGIGGYDIFEEAVENELGFERIKIGHHVPRILRKIKGIIIKKSVSGYYYRLLGKTTFLEKIEDNNRPKYENIILEQIQNTLKEFYNK